MGMKIIGEDGSLLYEFRDGLGAPLLYRLLAVAKFTGEDQKEIILNPHVAELHKAIASAMASHLRAPVRAPAVEEMSRDLQLRVRNVLRSAVLGGQHEWLSWDEATKAEYVRSILFAPYGVSEQFVSDFVEEEDSYYAGVRRSLDR